MLYKNSSKMLTMFRFYSVRCILHYTNNSIKNMRLAVKLFLWDIDPKSFYLESKK